MKNKMKIKLLIGLITLILIILIFSIIKLKYGNNVDFNTIEGENDILNKVDENESKSENLITDISKLGPMDLSVIHEDERVEENENDYIIHKVTNKTSFYTVKNCIENYLNCVYNLKEASNSTLQEKYKRNLSIVYSQLSERFIYENQITINNLNKYIDIKNSNVNINIIDMLELRIKGNYVNRYVVRAKLLDNDNTKNYMNYIVYLDYLNLTYSIEPIDNKITDLTTVDLKADIDEVPLNEYNKYKYTVVTD